MKANKEQNELFQIVSDKISKMIMDALNEQGFDDGGSNDEMIDPIITAGLATATEMAYHIGYDRGEILDKICDAIDNAKKYEDKLMCNDHSSLVEKVVSHDEDDGPQWIN